MQCLNLATKLSKKLPILIIFLSWFRDGLCFGIHKKMVQQYLQAFEVRLLNHFNLWCTSQQPLRVTTGIPTTQLTKLTCKRKTIIDKILLQYPPSNYSCIAYQIVLKCKAKTVSILRMHYLYTFIYTTRLLVYVLPAIWDWMVYTALVLAIFITDENKHLNVQRSQNKILPS